MSKAPAGGEGEGVSRWKQRQAAKAMMYAMSNEQDGNAIAARRQLTTAAKYVPQVDGWQGRAWGLSSTKVSGRQNPKQTRFSGGGSSRGELYYGQKRQFSTDLPPEDPNSFLARAPKSDSRSADGPAAKRSRGAEEVGAAPPPKEAAKAKREKDKKKRKSASGSGSDSDSGSSSSGSGSYSSSSSSRSRSRSKRGRKSGGKSGSGSSSSSSYSSSYSSYSSSGSDSESDDGKKAKGKKKAKETTKKGKGSSD